jgi:hypothetical protein
MKGIYLFLTVMLISLSVMAQDSRNPESARKAPEITYSAEQLAAMRLAVKEHPYTKYYESLVVEYQKRMKANVKKREVIARKMEKPQYSDPMYFGHKRKPKKRPVGKRKFCKECRIVH